MTSAAFPPLMSEVAELDPLEKFELTTGLYLYDRRSETLRSLVYTGDRNDWCGAEAPDDAPGRPYRCRCSRPPHPPYWRHAASNGDTLLTYWGPDEPAPVSAEMLDPQDGSEPDPVDVVLSVAELNLGHCYRLRDRSNVLYVIGGASDDPRGDDHVEVLDLHKRSYRLLPVGYVLPSDHVLTVDELGWVGSYIHKVRNAVRDEAVEQYLAERWCMEGLNRSLTDLGLQKYSPMLRGHIEVRIPFTAKDHSAGKSAVEALLKPALTKLLDGVQDPTGDNPLGVKLRKSGITINATEMTRR